MHYTIDSWRKKREREHLIDPCTDIFQEKKNQASLYLYRYDLMNLLKSKLGSDHIPISS
jgi:hypothetical protein